MIITVGGHIGSGKSTACKILRERYLLNYSYSYTGQIFRDMAEERGVTLSIAATDLLNQMARRRRQATLDWFEGKSAWSEVTSAELVREDRDAR